METVQYSIPSLAGSGIANGVALEKDLGNALTLLDGVGHVDINRETHMVTVDFDPDYMDLETLAYIIKGTGYPVDTSETVT
ncbi:MAG: hypothetical protein NVS2B16_08240 [Chloroflexota bacterium]